MTLSLKALNALLALSLMVLGTWFTNQSCQSLSSLVTCGLLLRISCCSNKSFSCKLGCLSPSCLSNSGRSSWSWWSGVRSWSWAKIILKERNQLSFSQLRITSQSTLFHERFQIYYSHILIVHFLAVTKKISIAKWETLNGLHGKNSKCT